MKKAKESFEQFDLFAMFNDLFEPETKPESRTEQVLACKEDYLQKGNRLEDLAREDFERRLKTLDVSKAEEAVCRVKFQKGESLVEMMRKIARQAVRPILRAMKTPEDLDELLSLLDSRFSVSVTMPEKPECTVGYVISNRAKRDPAERMLLLTIKEPDFPDLNVWGTKIACHPTNRKNVMFKDGFVVSDIAEVLSLLIILSEILAAQDNASFRDKQSTLIAEYKENCRYYPFEGKKFIESDMPTGRPSALLADAVKKRGGTLVCHPAHSAPFKLLNLGKLPDTQWLTRNSSYELVPVLWDDIKDDFHLHDILYCTDHEEYWASVPDIRWKRTVFQFFAELFLFIREDKLQDIQTLDDYRELSSGYAKSFQKKKNIPEKTVKAMEASPLNQYFGFVEFDEMVDLEKISEITDEFIAVKETYLPFIDSRNDSIRFRRLGNHKAAGLYYPHVKCLCVDIHNPYSMIHEYGHLIDYQYGSLSRMPDFEHIRRQYKTCLEDVSDSSAKKQLSGNTKYNMSYYLKPTEIFARSFELYMAKIKGVHNSLLPVKFGFEYPDNEMYLNAVKNYFDALFEQLGIKNAA